MNENTNEKEKEKKKRKSKFINNRNKKLLTNSELYYLLYKYRFFFKDGHIETKADSINSKLREISNTDETILFFNSIDQVDENSTRTNFTITPESKKLFLQLCGQLNLILIECVFRYQNKKHKTKPAFDLTQFKKDYNKILNEMVLEQGLQFKDF